MCVVGGGRVMGVARSRTGQLKKSFSVLPGGECRARPPELSVTPGRWARLRLWLLTSRRPLSCEPQRPRISWQVTAEGARGRNVDINQVSEVWLANTFSHSVGCLSSLLLPLMRRSLMQPHLSILLLLCWGDGRKQRARHPTAGIISEAGLLTHNM